MVAETARIRGEEISALLKVRLDAILEGLDLHGVPIDDSIKKRIVDDGMALRDTLVQHAVAAYQVNPVTAGLIPIEFYTPELEQHISVSGNSISTQIDRARLTKKPAANSITNIYHVHGYNPRCTTTPRPFISIDAFVGNVYLNP